MDLHSLRHRYAMFSILVGCLILIAASTAYLVLHHTRDKVATNIDLRHALIAQGRLIRNTLWQTRESLNQRRLQSATLQDNTLIRRTIQNTTTSIEQFIRLRGRELNHEQQQHMQSLLRQMRDLEARVTDSITPPSHLLIHDLQDAMLSEVLKLEANIESSAYDDVDRLTQLAQNQSYTIWALATLGVILVVIGFFLLDRYVLSPMSQLALAFYEEATGKPDVALPPANTTETQHLIAAFDEMRKQIHQRQHDLEHQALHDALTGLANRTLLQEEIINTIAKCKRNNNTACLILMDLDHFKEVNDTLGHQVGDQLLVEVSHRLRLVLRDSDLIARLGGDEFALLLDNTAEQDARNVCRKILKAFEKPFSVEQQQLLVGASLGVVIYPLHGQDADTLIRRADVAMYTAKRSRIGFCIYETMTHNQDQQYQHLSLANELQNALQDEELSVYYQLKYDLAYYEPIGVEALIRWLHPDKGPIPPQSIITIAEQTGLITRLTLWVLEKSIEQCAQWRSEGVYLSVAVNLSVYDLQSPRLVDQIMQLLREYDIPPSYLVIEVTENAMFVDPMNAVDVLQKLDASGIRIAVDDFGTGFSSLRYLKQLPVDELKIDKSFVMEMTDLENDAIIVRSTIELAHNLGLQVVAEGVEDQMTLEILQNLHCDMAQGFFMCKPVASDEVLNYIYLTPVTQVTTG